jgi:hypothetical protein
MSTRFLILGRCCLVLAAAAALSCSRKVDFTELEIKDPVRHYYPILQGQELTIIVPIENKGDVPLTIKDVQPTCGCIRQMESGEIFVPPGKPYTLILSYDSTKNVGKVEHTVRLWGNISPGGMAEFKFDVNVVPDASYHHDYEELYAERNPLKSYIDGVVNDTGLGYYIDK